MRGENDRELELGKILETEESNRTEPETEKIRENVRNRERSREEGNDRTLGHRKIRGRKRRGSLELGKLVGKSERE